MKYIMCYNNFLNESNSKQEDTTSNIYFIKLPKKNKDAKTDTYNVIKEDNVIGMIKWSSRLRGYSFLPTSDCEYDIKQFIKDLMKNRNKK